MVEPSNLSSDRPTLDSTASRQTLCLQGMPVREILILKRHESPFAQAGGFGRLRSGPRNANTILVNYVSCTRILMYRFGNRDTSLEYLIQTMPGGVRGQIICQGTASVCRPC
jgi:hypothetical protein